ncbi:MAG: hypothetical protein ACRETC_06055 [Gammaproteobacteria bacterium]
MMPVTRIISGQQLLLYIFMFVISWILLFVGCRIPQLQMPAGAAFGISLILASLITLFCAYLWQYKWFTEGMLFTHEILTLVFATIFLISIGLGVKINGTSVFVAILHAAPRSRSIHVRETWAVPLGVAGIVCYVEAWTVIRLLIRKRWILRSK